MIPLPSNPGPSAARRARPIVSKSMSGRTASPSRSRTSPTLRLAPRIGESRSGRQAFTSAALSVQHHDRLYEGADEVGNLATGRRVRIGIHSRDGAHDDERPADMATGE